MTRMLKLFLGLAALATLARAAPAPLFGINLGSGDESSDKPASVSQDDITSTLVRPAQFARAAYCSAASVTNWSCGDSCDVLPNVEVLTAGGDDGAIPGCEFLRSLPSATRALTKGVTAHLLQSSSPQTPTRRRLSSRTRALTPRRSSRSRTTSSSSRSTRTRRSSRRRATT